MIPTAFLLLVSFMCTNMVVCEQTLKADEVPSVCNHPDQQCFNHGHFGSCMPLMMESGKINCSRIECALDIHVKAKSHRAVDVGQAEDGTHCGDRSVCFHGSCTKLSGEATMPKVIGELPFTFKCHRASPRKPRYWSESA